MERDAGQLGDAVDEAGDLVAEARAHLLQRGRRVLDGVVQQRRAQRLGVQAQAGADLRHRGRMGDELLARLAALVGVVLAGEDERLLDARRGRSRRPSRRRAPRRSRTGRRSSSRSWLVQLRRRRAWRDRSDGRRGRPARARPARAPTVAVGRRAATRSRRPARRRGRDGQPRQPLLQAALRVAVDGRALQLGAAAPAGR